MCQYTICQYDIKEVHNKLLEILIDLIEYVDSSNQVFIRRWYITWGYKV